MSSMRWFAVVLTLAIVPAATLAACGGRSLDLRALGGADAAPSAPDDAGSDSDRAIDAQSDALAADGACLEGPEEPPGPHGSLDVSFGDGGVVPLPRKGDQINQMCVFGLPGDGAVAVGVWVTEGVGLIGTVGYNVAATGAIVASWSVPYQDLAACGQAPDGTVYIAGHSTAGPTTMTHFDAAGSPDTAFGTASPPFSPVGIAVSGTGDAVAVSGGPDLETARFGGDGGLAATTTLRPATNGKAIARGPSGQLFIAGLPTDAAVTSPRFARLAGDGVDPSWGNGGWATLPVNIAQQAAVLIAVDERDRLVVAATFSPGEVIVARFTSEGQPDVCFGKEGLAHVYAQGVRGVALQANGKVVMATDAGFFRISAHGDLETDFKPPTDDAAPDAPMTVLGGGAILARTLRGGLVRLRP